MRICKKLVALLLAAAVAVTSVSGYALAPESKFKQEKVRIYNGLEDVPGIDEAVQRSKVKLVDKRGARRQAAEFLILKRLPPSLLDRMEIYFATPPAELAPPDFLGIMYISDEYAQYIYVDDNRLYIAQPLVSYLAEKKPDCLRDYLSATIVYGAARLRGFSEADAEKMQGDFLESKGRKRDELISLLRELSHGIELSLGEVFWRQVKKFSRYSRNKALFKVKKDGRYIPISWAQAGREVLKIGLGLMKLMHKGERIAILSQNRPEAAYFDIASLSLGIVDVPLNPGASLEDIIVMLNDSRANVVVCGSEDDLNKVLRIKDKLPHIRKVVVMDAVPEELYSSFVMSIEELKALGKSLRKDDFMKRMSKVKLDDVATIMYTSGTSGAPKGICFTQKNVMAKRRSRGYVVSIDENDRLFCYLPLWHTFGRWLELWGSVYWGATYIFANSPRVDEILNDFQIELPTVFISVPSIWEEIYKEAMALAGEGAPDARIKDVLERVTGGRLKKWALTAAGYLDPKIIAFFNRHGVPLSSGYGLTEVTGGLTMTRPGDYVEGSIGQPLPGAEMRLGGGGVLYVRSPYVVPGYTDAARNTKKFSEGGWFNTGDVVSVGARGHMMIVGREGTKDIYKTKGGLTVSPQKVECRFQEDIGVKRAFLVGEGRSFNALLVVPRADFVARMLSDSGIENNPSNRELVFNEYFQGVLTRINPELGVGERVRRFAVIWNDFPAHLFSVGSKYKREEVVKYYSDVIEAVYRSDDEVIVCIEALEKSDDAAQDQVLIERLGELGDDRALGVLVRVLLEGEESFAAAIAIKKINSKLVKNAIQDQLAMMADRGVIPTPEINGHLVDILTYFGVRKNDLTKYMPRLSVRERKHLDEDVLYLNNVARRTLGGIQKVVRARVADSAKRSKIVRLAKDTLTNISFYVGEGTVRAKDRRIIVGFEKNSKGNGGVILISRRFMRSRAFERNKFSIVFYAALKMNEGLQQLIGSLPDEFKCRDINIEAVKPEWVTPLAGSPSHQAADSARRSLLAPESRMGGSKPAPTTERFLIALMNLAFGENLYDHIGNVNSIMNAIDRSQPPSGTLSQQGASNLGPFIDKLKQKDRRFQEITRGMHSIFRVYQNGRGFARGNGGPKEGDVPRWIKEFREGAQELQMILWRIEQAVDILLAKHQFERFPKILRNMREAVKDQLAFMDGAISREEFDLKDTLDKFEPTIKRIGLKLDIEFPEERVLVRGSRRTLTLAVWYLLENRIRQAYKAKGAQAEAKVRLVVDDRNCYLEITDNGLGIPDDVKDKIFDLDFALRPDGASIGASLACARFIVRDCGGDITFQNNPSSGVTFTMRLPCAEKSVLVGSAVAVRESL